MQQKKYKAMPPQQSTNTPMRKIKKQHGNGKINFQGGITNEIQLKQTFRSFNILDNEWFSLRSKVKYLYDETQKANIGQYLDGFGVAVLLPFGQSLFNILASNKVPESSDKNSCIFYGFLFAVYAIIVIVRKITKWRFISSYSDLKKDIEVLNERMDEIEKNLEIDDNFEKKE